MPKKLERDTQKVTINLFQNQRETLDSFYPEAGYSAVIRTLIDNHINYLKAQMPAQATPQIKIEELTK